MSDSLENGVGFFDLAVSYSGDSVKEAELVYAMASNVNLRCYDYRQYLDNQFGLNIYSIMEFVYSNCRVVAILNSPLYHSSEPTRFEFSTIRASSFVRNVTIFDLGGDELVLDRPYAVEPLGLSDDGIMDLCDLALEFKK